MGVKRRVFASAAEFANYQKLESRWGDRYSLCHNLPFLNVFDFDGLVDSSDWPQVVPITISDVDQARLKKTSIDYVLCDNDFVPLVCVEFDGLQDGFNVGTSYKAAEPTNPWRHTITTLKLKVAHGSLFPYFVVGVREFRDISAAIKLCVVDTLIGEVLSSRALSARANAFTPADLGMSDEDFDRLPPSDQDELIQDWFIGVEVEADFTFNPVFAALEVMRDAVRRALGSYDLSWAFARPPTATDHMSPIEYAQAFDNAARHGATCTVTTKQYGEVSRTIWLPNFRAPGYSELGFLPELAQLVALDAVRQLALKRSKGVPVRP